LGRWGRGGQPPPRRAAGRRLWSVGEGVTRPSLVLPTAALVAAVFAGCGEGSGVEEGATVRIYAGAAVCPGAKDELRRAGEKVGSVRVRVVCAAPVEAGGKLDLATAGANARHAVEDSTTVGYLEAPGAAIPFTRPILDEAEVALIVGGSGASGMATVLDALRSRGGSESPREAVWNR
jgi:hypothetical protein